MSSRYTYDIPFVGLKIGTHTFKYEIDDTFFEAFQPQEFEHCKALVDVSLEKNVGLMRLKFDVSGSVEVPCDRCGNILPIKLWDEFVIIVKMVDNPDEMNDSEEDPDIFYISHQESHLHLKDWIYEFINLSIPTQKDCGEDEQGGSLCNREVLNRLKMMKEGSSKGTSDIWKGLDKFKDLDRN